MDKKYNVNGQELTTFSSFNEVPKSVFGTPISEKDRFLLHEGTLSGLIENVILDGNPVNLKIKLSRDNSNIKAHLYLQDDPFKSPDDLFSKINHKPTTEDLNSISKKQTLGPFFHDDNQLYFKFDKDLNKYITTSSKELNIPDGIKPEPSFGFIGHDLTKEEKNELANTGKLRLYLYSTDKGFFFLDVKSNPDRTYELSTFLNINPDEQIKNLEFSHSKTEIQEHQQNSDVNKNVTTFDAEMDRKFIEFYDAIDKKDFQKLFQLKNENLTPQKNELNYINTHPRLSDEDKIAIREIFNIKEEQTKETIFTKRPLTQEEKEKQAKLEKDVHSVTNVLNQAFNHM